MTLRIGPYTLASPWLLAPMAGVSELPFRAIVLELGAGGAPTELISAKGLVYGSARTEHYLARHERERPFWVQLFAGEAEALAEGAALAVDAGAEIIDLNMGCPVKKVTRTGAGAALLRDVAKAGAVCAAVTRRVCVPVTAKIRAGHDLGSLNFLEISRALADAGCQAIALHARTATQSYGTKATWEWIRRLVEASPLPIIGNGDALTFAAARRMLAETGCAAVMIGRGACGNPWLFRDLCAGEERAPTPAERLALVCRHLEGHLAFVGDEDRALRSFRPHFGWYSHGVQGATEFRRRIMRVRKLDEARALMTDLFLAARGQAR